MESYKNLPKAFRAKPTLAFKEKENRFKSFSDNTYCTEQKI